MAQNKSSHSADELVTFQIISLLSPEIQPQTVKISSDRLS